MSVTPYRLVRPDRLDLLIYPAPAFSLRLSPLDSLCDPRLNWLSSLSLPTSTLLPRQKRNDTKMENITLLPPSACSPAIVLSPAPTLNEPYAQLIISQARQHTFHPNAHLSVAYGFKFAPARPEPSFLEATSFALGVDLMRVWSALSAFLLAFAGVFTSFFSVLAAEIGDWDLEVLGRIGGVVTALASWDLCQSSSSSNSRRLPAPVSSEPAKAAGTVARRIAALLALSTITLALGSLHMLVAEGNGPVLEHMLDLH